MNVTRLFIAYHRINSNLVESIKERLDNFAILSHEEDLPEEDLAEFIKETDEMADGYLFLLTGDALASKGFTSALKDRAELTTKSGKFFIPMFIGDVPVPDYIYGVPSTRIEKYASIEDLAGIAARQINAWVRPEIKNSDETLPRDEQLYLKNLLVNLSAATILGFGPLISPIIPLINEFWGKVEENPKLLENNVSKEIIKIVETIPEEIMNNNQSDCYFLKINSATWIISELVPGYTSRFHTHDLQGNRRVDYDLFKNLKLNDRAIGFVFQEYNAVMCVFEVIQIINIDQQHGEGVTLKVTKQISPTIPLIHFKDQIGFANKLDPDHSERLFKISEDQFNSILGTKIVGIRPASEHDKDASFAGDLGFDKTIDQLDFQNDINSFAAVIALEKVTPPLAIGLFGEWGAGKSFFMEKLCERINTLSGKKGSRYLKNIVQVKFNAWHYSDGNLWASLVTHIFEELNHFAQDTKFDEESVKELYAKLDLATIAITEKQDEVDQAANEVTKIEQNKAALEQTLQDKKDKLTMLTAHDIIGVVIKEPAIQAIIRKIKQEEPTIEFISDINDIDTRLAVIDTDWKRLKEAYSILTDQKGSWWKVSLIVSLLVIFGYLLFFTPFNNYIAKAVSYLISIVGSFLAFLKSFDWLKPHLRTLRKSFNRMKSLKQSIQNRADQLEYSETEDILKLQKEINEMVLQQNVYKEELENKKLAKTRLEEQIEDIGSGRLIANFLAGKSAEDGYGGELGIISRIRKDFTQLNRLFKQQKAVDQTKYANGERFQIDRIVLYVDDLDRCSTDVVIKTLEAVHLLLAFELFVVVVGVDSRWLDYSLQEKYKHFTDDDKNSCTTENQVYAITSFDYLEKIFQIPFAIKTTNDSGRRKLIHYLTEKDIEIIAPQLNQENFEAGNEVKEEKPIAEIIESNNPDQNIEDPNDKKELVSQLKDMMSPISSQDELEVEVEERVTVSLDEIKAMQDMAFLFGHTPRKIKRYINIYRIIKAHRSYKISTVHSRNDYLPTMLLLAIVVGFPREAKEFIVALEASTDMVLYDFIEKLEPNSVKGLLKKLPEQMARTIHTNMLSENLLLVSRFSFRCI